MKKNLLVLSAIFISLTSCHMKGEKIPVKQAIKELGICEADVNNYDDVKVKFNISKCEYEKTEKMGKETQGQKITAEDIKFESSMENIVSAKNGNELKEVTTFSLKSISMDSNGADVFSLNNLYYSTILDNGRMYTDLSNDGMYMLMCSLNPELENLEARKYCQTVNFSNVSFPLVSGDKLTSQSQELSDKLIQIFESKEFEPFAATLEKYSDIYISEDHRDFDIYFDYRGNGLIPVAESGESGFNLSQNLYVHIFIEDGLVKKGDFSLDFGGESVVQGYTFKNKLVLKGYFNIDYGAKVDDFANADDYTLIQGNVEFEM